MKKLVEVLMLSVCAVAIGALLTVSAMAGSVKDFCVPVHNGAVSVAQMSIAVRKGYQGVNPKIRAINSIGFPFCSEARFRYKNELKRITFNCTETRVILSIKTR